MDFIKTLKTRSILKVIGWFIFFVLFGSVFIIGFFNDPQIMFLLMGLFFIVIGFVFLIPALTGKHQKQVMAKARELAGERYETVLDCAAQLYRERKATNGLRINYGLVFWEKGAEQKLFDIRDICWLYQKTTTRVYGIIPAGKSYALMIKTRDGHTMEIPLTKKKVQPKLQELLPQFPKAIAGYSKEREELYNKDKTRFAEAAAKLRAQQDAK